MFSYKYIFFKWWWQEWLPVIVRVEFVCWFWLGHIHLVISPPSQFCALSKVSFFFLTCLHALEYVTLSWDVGLRCGVSLDCRITFYLEGAGGLTLWKTERKWGHGYSYSWKCGKNFRNHAYKRIAGREYVDISGD